MPQINKDSELVIGLISTVGTEIDNVISCLCDYLAKFSYKTVIINVSSDVLSKFGKTNFFPNEYERIKYFMNLGNSIREKTGDSAVLMKGVVSKILEKRDSIENPSPRDRVAYIVKSIKHPDEIEFLRSAYGVGFHLIGITSSYERRNNYLTGRKSLTYDQAKELLSRDANEKEGHGQHTQDAFQQSDYFISIGNLVDDIQHSVSRLVDLLFGNPFISPSFPEYAMFMAYSSSLRSADLSRQIGSVITKGEEIVASGANDCPKAFGGLYWPEFKNGEYKDIQGGRDYTLGLDYNKIEQRKIITDILTNLQMEQSKDNIDKIKSAGISDLTEYGRVVHGEMEALMMCARNNISCKGATMYVTTFPCHNCAKHIIAAGIEKVVYIEPYPKSKALDFYKNEITEDPGDSTKVQFTPFVGVGPHRFIDLFSVTSIQWYAKIRKDKSGKKLNWARNDSNLRSPMVLFNYLDYEKAAYKAFYEEVSAFKEGKPDGEKS